MQTVTLSNRHLRAEFLPPRGGLLSRLRFDHPQRGWVDAMVTEHQPPSYGNDIPFFGCFLMAPFANRIPDGILQGDGHRFHFPIALASENLAIHGTGWNQPWTAASQAEDEVVLKTEWSSPVDPYAFEGQLTAVLEGSSLRLTLQLTNLADISLPMGMGFHPWFPSVHTSRVTLDSDLPANRESPWSLYPDTGFERLPAAFTPASLDGLDSTFDGWNRRAEILLSDRGLHLQMWAMGAVSRLHAFVMGDNDRFCLEPVSHKPGDLGDPACQVAPGQSLSGTMVLTGTTV